MKVLLVTTFKTKFITPILLREHDAYCGVATEAINSSKQDGSHHFNEPFLQMSYGPEDLSGVQLLLSCLELFGGSEEQVLGCGLGVCVVPSRLCAANRGD